VAIEISEGDKPMRSSELNRLLEALRKDPDLLNESRGLLRDSDAALQWAVDRGYRLTLRDIAELSDSDRELSDDDLEEAAGGAWPPP
jgi:predicted ribosomally synthesized peptide with nif11-like leader